MMATRMGSGRQASYRVPTQFCRFVRELDWEQCHPLVSIALKRNASQVKRHHRVGVV